jgi:hypothetical protein
MARIQDFDETANITAPNARRFLALLQGLDESDNAEAEWRRLEQEWLAAVLRQPVVSFDDAQIAAELMARHRWEDAGTRTEVGRTAYLRLHELRLRRGLRETVDCWPAGNGS